MEVLFETDRKARKPHICSYCGEIIEKGELYEYARLKADDLYEWKNHKRCGFIASELWKYINPDDGMTADDFKYGCHAFSRRFICPDCPQFDRETDCKKDREYVCTEKIFDFLQTHELVRDDKTSWVWKCIERKKK